MCINNNYIDVARGPGWERVPVPCKKCWQCKQRRLDDYVGRCLAEAAVSETSCTVTLTYAPRDDLADKLIHPKHFQIFMKRLRASGHLVRYLVAAEYGDLKGRTHFHALLFFKKLLPLAYQYPLYGMGIVPRYKDDYLPGTSQDDAPFCRDIAQKRMVHIREWPHGHIKVDWSQSEASIRYVCKYILHDDKTRAWFSLSKKPPLGAEWFAQKAAQARELGILPNSFNYLPPGGDRDRTYYMSGATRRDFLNAVTTDPKDRPRMSEWVAKTFDKHERQRLLDELNDQTSEQLLDLFLSRAEDEADREHKARLWALYREQNETADLLAKSSDNTLRWVGNRWTPNIKR